MTAVRGKVVLITGSARGIGAEVARRLHGKGAKLVLIDLDEVPLKELAAELGAARVHTVVGDVRDLAAMEGAVGAAVERFGGVDIVMANAGIASYGSVLGVDPAVFNRVIGVNLVGVFNTVRAALPSVIERRGYVLIVSSAAAFAAGAGMAPYATAKAGIEHFANALRLEVRQQGVRVGAAHMSWIDTQLVRDGERDLSAFREWLSLLPGPLGKLTTVDACAEAFVTGIERRKRRIYCPGWVGVMFWLRPLLATRVYELAGKKARADLLARMDAEVAALGRSTSARTEALENRPRA